MPLYVENAPLLPAIGGTVVSGTVGSVLFIGTGPVLAEDNANFFWDDTNNRLGIAVAAAPSYTLDVGGFINTNVGSGYKQNGQTILRGLTTGGTANYLTAVGAGVMPSATGADNTAVGYNALAAITSGASNVAVGSGALTAVQTVSNQVAIGYQALYSSTTGTLNMAIGYRSGYANQSGVGNVAFGDQALSSTTSSHYNLAIGANALRDYNPGAVAGYNVAIGFQALVSVVGTAGTAINNSALGANAMAGSSASTGSGNVAIGANAMLNFRTAATNIAIGASSLSSVRDGAQNIGIGYLTLSAIRDGTNNVAIGALALSSDIDGSHNICLGTQAMRDSTSSLAVGNIAIGLNTLLGQNGSYSVAIGYSALFASNASNNIAVGYQAGDNLTTGANNLVIGHNIDAMSATASNQMTIGNYLFATGIDGTGTTVSAAKFGLGVPAPTAKLSVVAGTSSIPQINLASSTAPSSPAAGDIWYDGTDVVFKDGVKCATIDTGNGAVELAAGTYTPTLTNTTNISASTAYQCQYLRVGNTVTVSGSVDIDPTAASTLTALDISLPIASTFGAPEDCGGVGASAAVAGLSGQIYANATTAQLNFKTSDTSNRNWSFTFTYQKI